METHTAADGGANAEPSDGQVPQVPPERKPHPDARKCRICHDWVDPTYEELSVMDRMRGKKRKKYYRDEDGGYLVSPCQCKGSMGYIHENCLRDMRYSNLNNDIHRKCPTCKFEYRYERLAWAQRLRSPILAFFLAVLIVIICIFLLGFVADPILSLWLDPLGTLQEGIGLVELDKDEFVMVDEFDGTWTAHFIKGSLSLGLVGFVKAFLAMSPFQWWNLRATGIVGGGTRRGGTGRERTENISLALVMIGMFTFFWAVWKGTRSWTQRSLDKASEKIMNIQPDDDDNEDEAETKKDQ